MSIKDIAVIGASKGIGLASVIVALDRGWNVRALSRQPIPLQNEKLNAVSGSILDMEKVRETVQGASAVILTVGSSISFKEVTLFSKGTKVLIDVLLGWNPKAYLMVVTGIGAGDSRGHGGFVYDNLVRPVLLKKVYQDKDRQEDLVVSSKLDWTIVRPGFLTDGPLTGVYRCLDNLDQVKAGKISRLDCADFLIKEAEARVWKGKFVLLG